jgi:hypothetical protein
MGSNQAVENEEICEGKRSCERLSTARPKPYMLTAMWTSGSPVFDFLMEPAILHWHV